MNTQNIKTVRVSLSALFLMLFVGIAFIYHLIIYTIPGAFFSVIITAITLFYVLTKRVYINKEPYYLVWLAALLVVIINYMFVYRNGAVLSDFIVLFDGFVIILFSSRKSDEYEFALKTIKTIPIIFSAGIFLQSLMPSLYRNVIRIFPSEMYNILASDLGGGLYGVKGFTTNVGFAAGYLIAGIIAILSYRTEFNRLKRSDFVLLCIYSLSLLLTAKRGPTLFLILTIIMIYILPRRGSKKVRQSWRVFLIFLVLIVVIYIMEPFLSGIPIFQSIINTITKYQSGEDITSGRSALYAWALTQFYDNPLSGIGWGKYRTTVAGVVTRSKELAVHNVYLQLLCETGVIGFIFFATVFVISWVLTKNEYISTLEKDDYYLSKWRKLLFFSFAYQTYFLLYCITGNPLYDTIFEVLYAFSCAISIAFKYCKKY